MSYHASDFPSPGRMPTTKWTLIERLRADDEETSRAAIEDLCRIYHYPLYCRIRRHGLAHHDAEDVLHDFLAKLLRNEGFGTADAEKGRLRSYLLVSLKHFLQNWRRDRRKRLDREFRFGIDGHLAQAELRYEREKADGLPSSQDLLFDRQWGRELMRLTMARLRERYRKKGREALFETLLPVLESGGTLADHDTAGLAEALSMRTGALRTALHRLLKDYREALYDEVTETVRDRSLVQEELDLLMAVFSGD